jgi:hypothetical protein
MRRHAAARRHHETEKAMDYSRMKIVYVITKRKEKSYWNRIGVAFVNQDGSLNVKLEAFPASGECHIRDYSPREDSVPSAAREVLSTENGQSEAYPGLT